MFRIDYIGNAPYLTCQPSLHHHKLGSKDRFLILSSDGLYQYFTNEEAVSEVELFIILQPDGDPAQHLVEEVLFRAAKRAGTNISSQTEYLSLAKTKIFHPIQEWIFMNCWKFHKEIEEDTTTMYPLLLYH